MDGNTLQTLRNELLARWKKLTVLQSQAAERDDSLNVFGQQPEMVDMAQSLEQMGRDTSLQEAERRELLAIEKALAKMATGSFGICEECGEDIPLRRLQVVPEAKFCASCQALSEKQNQRSRLVQFGA